MEDADRFAKPRGQMTPGGLIDAAIDDMPQLTGARATTWARTQAADPRPFIFLRRDAGAPMHQDAQPGLYLGAKVR